MSKYFGFGLDCCAAFDDVKDLPTFRPGDTSSVSFRVEANGSRSIGAGYFDEI